MSALSLIITRRQAHLVTDGAASAGGSLVCCSVKVMPLPHLNIAAGFRGPMNLMPALFSGVAAARDLDDLLTDFDAGLERFMQSAAYLASPGDFEIAIAGCRDRKPFSYLASTYDRLDFPRLRLLPVDAMYCSPPVPVPVMEKAYARAQSDTPADLRAVGRTLVDEQRNTGEALVGAFVQVTSVGDQGAFTFIAHRYADHFAPTRTI